jgi:hypothetical protein
MQRLICLAALAVIISTEAFAREIAICGASSGYGFYPKAGLAALDQGAGEWHSDGIKDGRFTLTEIDKDKFDLLVTDATGAVYSATQDGAAVVLIGVTDKSLSVVVTYPNTYVETYTFIRTEDGQTEAMWTSNKWGTLIPKVGAYRASCSFFAP